MDSPIETLAAFDHLSLGVLAAAANSLWTWLALLTAALSFWRIRSSSAVISISLRSQPLSDSPEESTPGRIDAPEASVSTAEEAIPPPSAPAPVKSTKSQSIFEDGGGVTKGKFAVYFADERVDNGEDEIETESESEVAAAGEWEYGGVLRLRMGDLGWYRHLDLTAFNGNVVRLWDGVSV